MENDNLVLVDKNDLRQIIHEAVFDAVNECLPQSIPDDNPYYSIRDVAQKWGICDQTVWRYTKEKRLKFVKVGKLIRFDKEYIDNLKSLGEVRTPGCTRLTKAERNIRKRK